LVIIHISQIKMHHISKHDNRPVRIEEVWESTTSVKEQVILTVNSPTVTIKNYGLHGKHS
jgi:hypothetical protein